MDCVSCISRRAEERDIRQDGADRTEEYEEYPHGGMSTGLNMRTLYVRPGQTL